MEEVLAEMSREKEVAISESVLASGYCEKQTGGWEISDKKERNKCIQAKSRHHCNCVVAMVQPCGLETSALTWLKSLVPYVASNAGACASAAA